MLFLLIGTLFALSLTPIALGATTVPAAYERRSFNVRELFNVSPLGVVGVLVIGLANGAFYSLGPIFAARLGFDTAGIGKFMAAAILSGLIMQWPLGKLSDVFDRRTILIIVAFLTCAVAVGIAGVSVNPAADHSLILILICAYGSALYALYPLAVAHANDHVEPADTVPLAAGLLLAYGVGALLGPFLASAVMALLGMLGLFTFIAGTAGALAIFGLLRMRISQAVPMDDQGTFMPLPRTSPVLVAEMHAMTDFEDAEFEDNADEEVMFDNQTPDNG
jgi:MFS family permease